MEYILTVIYYAYKYILYLQLYRNLLKIIHRFILFCETLIVIKISLGNKQIYATTGA